VAKTKPKNLKSRLDRLEQELAQIEEKRELTSCICGIEGGIATIGRGMEAEFRREMERPCPLHGFRELFILHAIDVEPGDFSSPAKEIEYPEVNALLEEYERRLAESNEQIR
jgi:hypothetical protein